MKDDMCCKAGMYYYDYIEGDLSGVPEDVQLHITSCEECQNKIKSLKDSLSDVPQGQSDLDLANINVLESQMQLIGKPVHCVDAKSFLPIFACKALTPGVETPITHHLDNCDACRKLLEQLCGLELSSEAYLKLSELLCKDDVSVAAISKCLGVDEDTASKIHKMLLNDSGIVTLFNDNSDKSILDESEEEIYEEAHKRHNFYLPGILKPLAAIAALFALVIFANQFLTTNVQAVDIENIYDLIAEIQYVTVSSYSSNGSLINQRWVSVPDDQTIFVQKNSVMLLDFKNKKHIYTKNSETIVNNLPSGEADGLRERYSAPWGLLPFCSYREVPDNYSWQELSEAEGLKEGEKCFLMTWSAEVFNGDPVWHKWIGYFADGDVLPYRIEFYSLNGLSDDYRLTRVITAKIIEKEDYDQAIRESKILEGIPDSL